MIRQFEERWSSLSTSGTVAERTIFRLQDEVRQLERATVVPVTRMGRTPDVPRGAPDANSGSVILLLGAPTRLTPCGETRRPSLPAPSRSAVLE